jgi:signal transduction histidine kinase/ActR/RegA family two-component response regulator
MPVMRERRRRDARAWREHLLRTLTHWSALFGGVIAIGVVVRTLAIDFVDVRHPAFAAMFAGYGAIVVLRMFPRLPYRVRAVTLSGSCFVAAASAVVLRGLSAAPVLLLGLGVLLAALFLGRKGMIGSLTLAGGTVALIGRPEAAANASPWFSAIDFVCVAGVLTILVQVVVTRLEESLVRRREAFKRLRAEQALRERTQAELTRAQATLLQAQKLDALGRLAGGVAHDFNNTLQVVLGWTEMLREATDPQQMRDGIEQIHGAAERSRGLTRQLLAFSRPELSSPKRVKVHELLPALIKSFRRLLPDDISIVAHTDQELSLLMDEGHLSQVLLNIVLNARDAMPAGGTLALTTRFIPRAELPPVAARFDSGAVEIEVTDTGTGMDEETRSRAFEPFFTTKGKRGNGLGLSTAYAVVQRAHGAIDLKSEPGQGTSVKLFFPALTSAEDPLPAAAERTSRPVVAQTVLLAEDDRDVRTPLARALRQAGHHVVEVADVEAGRAVVRQRGTEFAVLVTDGIMPGGSTRDLINDFLVARPDGRVIVCSGYMDDELSARALGGDSFEFVQKPIAPSELVSRLGSAAPSREVPLRVE